MIANLEPLFTHGPHHEVPLSRLQPLLLNGLDLVPGILPHERARAVGVLASRMALYLYRLLMVSFAHHDGIIYYFHEHDVLQVQPQHRFCRQIWPSGSPLTPHLHLLSVPGL